MQTGLCRTISNGSPRWCVLLLIFSGLASGSSAAEVRLKNGTIVRGNLLVMNAMGDRAVGKAALAAPANVIPTPHIIARMDTGWQRIYFPVQQDSQQAAGLTGANPVTIAIPIRKQAKTRSVTSFGSMVSAEPFDEFGRRSVKIAVDRGGELNVFQAINQVTPDHVMVESLNCDWKFGLGLKTLPVETIEQLLRKQVKADDPVARFGLVRFYTQAEYYKQAFNELDLIATAFPDRKELVEKSQAELMNYFGGEILRHLGRRKKAGQHEIGQIYAKQLSTQSLTGAVQQDVQQFVRTYEQSRQSIERAKLLLGEWQAKLNDAGKEKLVQPFRSEINEQLDFETLPRLDAFLKAESDVQYEPAQRLGLAYSAWVLGPANAIPDLDQAIRVWDARNTVLEYLRSDDPSLDIDLLKKLQSMESISADVVLNLTAQLPPIIDSSDIEPGTPHLVETADDKQTKYWATLPAEYSPHHSYPLAIILRPRARTAEQAVWAWAGDPNDIDRGIDRGINRGYIVIAPEYAEKGVDEYSFGAPAHKYILDCLIDARKRFAVDSDRVFLAGHGMGADAAYDIGMAHPDEFAGVLALGGNAINYCLYTADTNGFHTAWYAIGKGYDSEGVRDITSNPVFDKMMRKGFKYDFMLVEYLGRNGENLIDEIPKLFDWMDLHVRPEVPKQFKVCSLRRTDNRFFWVTANGLPRDFILPAPVGANRAISPMEIEVKAAPGNTIFLKSPTDNYTLRLTPELVDFEKRLLVRVNGKVEFTGFVKREMGPMLQELRSRGDRKRLPLAILTPGKS